jgi:hypothetical protein
MGLFSFKKKKAATDAPLPSQASPDIPRETQSESLVNEPTIPQALLDLEAGLPSLVHHPRPSRELQAQYVALQSLDFSNFSPDVVTRILDALDTFNQLTLQRDSAAASNGEAVRADLVTLRALLDVGGSTQEIEEQLAECELDISVLVSNHPTDPVISVLNHELEELRTLWLARKSTRSLNASPPHIAAVSIPPPVPQTSPPPAADEEELWTRITNSLTRQKPSESPDEVHANAEESSLSSESVPDVAEIPEEPITTQSPVNLPDPFAVLEVEDSFGDFAVFEMSSDLPEIPVRPAPAHFDLSADESPIANIEPTFDDLNRKILTSDFQLAVMNRDPAKIEALLPVVASDDPDAISDLIERAHRILAEAAILDSILKTPLNLDDVKSKISALDTYPPATDSFVSRIFPVVPLLISKQEILLRAALSGWLRQAEISRVLRLYVSFTADKKIRTLFTTWRDVQAKQSRRFHLDALWRRVVQGISARAKFARRFRAQEELEREIERELANMKRKNKTVATRIEGKDVVYVADPPDDPHKQQQQQQQQREEEPAVATTSPVADAVESQRLVDQSPRTWQNEEKTTAEIDKWAVEALRWRVFRSIG